MKNQHEVYRIISKDTNKPEGVYSRAYHDEYDFESIKSARSANCHGIYKDKNKYKIAKYKVTYELIDDDCDPITKEELIEIDKKKKEEIELKKRNEELAMKILNKHYCDLTLEEQISLIIKNKLGDIINENKIL